MPPRTSHNLCNLAANCTLHIILYHLLMNLHSKNTAFVLRASDTINKNNISSRTTYITNSLLGMENARIPILLIGLSERNLLGNG